MLSLITPTRNRAEAFDLLQRWVAAQIYDAPLQWIVVNDGIEPYEYRMGQEVLTRRPDVGGESSQKKNILQALPHVRGDKILILEDDDYYYPDYLGRMDAMLDRFSLVGEGRALYYNVRTRRYRVWSNVEHASLAQTGLRAEALPALAEVCNAGDRCIDIELWSRFGGLKHIFTGAGLHVGIKGMPGEPGIFEGHKDEGTLDTELQVFRAWEIPAVYENYHVPRATGSYSAPGPIKDASSPTNGFGGPDRWDLIAPLGVGERPKRYEGRSPIKPWNYRVTAILPHLNTPHPLRWAIETLRHQTEPPYILVVDTGSDEATCRELEAMRSVDLEIHYLRSHAWTHASEPVAIAMDVAMALVHTEFLYCTHADCFIRRPDWIEWLLSQCSPGSPVIGYQMSDRSWLTRDWEWMVSHTTTMLHMPTMRRINASWSFERFKSMRSFYRPEDPDWMDTETGFNWSLRQAGIVPVLLSPEFNYERQTDDNIDHVRSYPSATLYQVGSPAYQDGKERWMESAISEAEARVREWSRRNSHDSSDGQPN